MFRFILGTAGSGKSRYCLEQITSLARNGKETVIVVPEQTGFTYERELVARLPGVLGSRTRVMSFRSISRFILRECGGSARVRLGDAQKTAFARRAMIRRREELTCYSRSREFAFYGKLSELFDELRSAGATPSELREIGSELHGTMSAEKFEDIASIMEEYEGYLGEEYLDDAGEIRFAAEKIPLSGFFRGKEVFFDAFSGFTDAEYEMIRQIASAAGLVTFSLCCTGSDDDRNSSLAVPYRTYQLLRNMSSELFAGEPEKIVLGTNERFRTSGLRLAEMYFRDFSILGDGNAEGVKWFTGNDRYDEAKRVADEIVTLTRENGYRFSDISVLFRDADQYRDPVTRTFSQFGIPFIFDEGEDMLSAPGTVFMLCALEMASGIRTDSLMRMLKTDLCDISVDEIALLEDYSFIHGIDGGEWFVPFSMSPSGFGLPEGKEEEKILEDTERARIKVSEWIRPFLDREGKEGKELVRAAYEMMDRCGAVETVEKNDKAGRHNAELLFDIIQQLYDMAEREELSGTELPDTLRILARSTRSADIPRVGDGVFVGVAGHSRPFNPKASFVMGLNDGVFPRDITEGNLFTLEERDILSSYDLVLGGNFDQNTDLESFFLYGAVTSPSDKLYLSYPGGDLLPCAELEGFIKVYGIEHEKEDPACGIVNIRTARGIYAEARSERDEILAASLLSSDAGDACREYEKAVGRRDMVIEDDSVAQALAGDVTGITASRMQTYEECRFMFFLQYLAGIRPLRKAEMSPDVAGSFVHDVMENLMREFSGDLTGCDEIAIRNACRRLADEYIDRMVGEKGMTPRMRVISDQIRDNCIRLARRLRAEQMQSEFRADGFELNIGTDIPGPVVVLDDGHRAEVFGKIDRVDTYTHDGETYVRIVDYKTGGKDFKLSDVWQGLNVQMLLYLFAVKNNGTARYGENIVPAGVLYMPGDPSPASEEEDAGNVYTMKGLVLNDPDVLQAMERDGSGLFIPASIDPRTGRWKTGNIASLEELGKIEKRIEQLVREMASGIRAGDIRAIPAEDTSGNRPCRYCYYRAVCGADRIEEPRRIRNISRKEMFGEEESDG
ncbi:MAG: PD-(D/E)XK nuclease family protein [Oscillospiraceae bacterium]|nr:PD-(D/E)XK nuclease family protein [Oscillospiraceae bacterium]